MKGNAILICVIVLITSCANKSKVFEPGQVQVIESFDFQSIPNRNVEVYLPPGYTDIESYPVIYIHDGQNVFNSETSSFGTAWEVDDILDSLINSGEVNPAIVVAVWNDQLRWNEYLPEICIRNGIDSTWKFPFIRKSVLDTSVFSNAYLKSLAFELKPFIDEHYSTKVEPENTYLMGSSMGGLISFYGVALHPEVYGGAACLSTHWTAIDGACLDAFSDIFPESAMHKRFYFDHGDKGLDAAYSHNQSKMDSILRKAGYDEINQWNTEFFPNGDHNEASWQNRVSVPLTFLLGKKE